MNAPLSHILQVIADAARRAGRNPTAIRLLAVSKTKPAEDIRALYAQGQRWFGENYADELIKKAESLKDLDIKWSFIGQLQSNKIARLIPIVAEIQTVSSEKHLRFIDRYARECNKSPFPIFLEVNIGQEDSKAGFSLTAAQELAKRIPAEFPNVDLRGLMAIPPSDIQDTSPGQTIDSPPKIYLDLAQAAVSVGKGELSLGMSGDLGLAIAAGSTCVRIGRALFGARS